MVKPYSNSIVIKKNLMEEITSFCFFQTAETYLYGGLYVPNKDALLFLKKKSAAERSRAFIFEITCAAITYVDIIAFMST